MERSCVFYLLQRKEKEVRVEIHKHSVVVFHCRWMMVRVVDLEASERCEWWWLSSTSNRWTLGVEE